MKCNSCGYDKILPMYKFCPKCKSPLNTQTKEAVDSDSSTQSEQSNTKLIGMLLMSYKKAIQDPKGFGEFCKKHPNDSRRLWQKWIKEGRDLSLLEDYNPTSSATVSKPKKKEEKTEEHQAAVQGAQAASAVASSKPKVAESDVVAVGSRNKEHNYVTWSIAPGQIARNISAQAFQELEKVDGVYVQEGVTAVIFVDGEQVAELQGGLYKFATEKIQRDAAEKEEDERSKESIVRKIGRAGRSLWALITGNRDKYNKEEARKKRERVKKIAQKLSGNSVVAVVLKRDSAIQVTMGIRPVVSEDGTSQMEFAPYKIRTKTLTLDVAVALEIRISDFREFRTTYLMDQMSYSVNDVRMALNTWMRTTIQRHMQDYEADGQLIPTELLSAISYDINSQSQQLLHGIVVSQVLDITTENEAFDRFRAIEEKFYCTEKEIDYLMRTNEFKNRLQNEENAQKLREARTELDLRKELDSINNDQLVHEDEMEAFVQLLQSQKRIRDARTENEELAALLELKGNRLISEDEFDALENSIRDKKFDREQVSAEFQMRAANRTSMTRVQLDLQLSKSQLLAEAELEDIRFEELKKRQARQFQLDETEQEHNLASARRQDEYDDTRREKDADFADTRREKDFDFEQRQKDAEYERTHREAKDNIDIERQRSQNEMDILRQKAELARQNMQAMQQHEQELAEKKHQEEMARIAAQQSMTAEQLMATGMAGMDAAAQKAFAESFAAGKGGEKEREMYERMLQMQQQHAGESSEQSAAQMEQMQAMMRQMMEFAQSGMQTNAQMAANMAAGQAAGQQAQLDAMQNIAAGRQAEVNAMKDEYRQQMMHEQARVDHTQDAALNYTTKVTQSTAPASTPSKQNKEYYLPDFGQSYTRQEIENYIMQGVVHPDTEIDANGINGKVCEQEEFFSFCLQKYGVTCPRCGKKYLSELGICTECGYEE